MVIFDIENERELEELSDILHWNFSLETLLFCYYRARHKILQEYSVAKKKDIDAAISQLIEYAKSIKDSDSSKKSLRAYGDDSTSMRFYIHRIFHLYCSGVDVFSGNLPCNYEDNVKEFLYKFLCEMVVNSLTPKKALIKIGENIIDGVIYGLSKIMAPEMAIEVLNLHKNLYC